MIIAAVMALMSLFGGTDSFLPADFDERVEQHVPEGARRDSIQAVAEQIEDVQSDYLEQLEDTGDRWVGLSKDYDSSADEAIAVWDEARRERLGAQQSILRLRRQLVELLSEEEWAVVFAPEDEDD